MNRKLIIVVIVSIAVSAVLIAVFIPAELRRVQEEARRTEILQQEKAQREAQHNEFLQQEEALREARRQQTMLLRHLANKIYRQKEVSHEKKRPIDEIWNEKDVSPQEIKETQQLLNYLFGKSLEINGKYDENTKRAIIEYIDNERKESEMLKNVRITCLHCMGSGKKKDNIKLPLGITITDDHECIHCKGKGYIDTESLPSLKRTVVKPNPLIKSILNEQEKE